MAHNTMRRNTIALAALLAVAALAAPVAADAAPAHHAKPASKALLARANTFTAGFLAKHDAIPQADIHVACAGTTKTLTCVVTLSNGQGGAVWLAPHNRSFKVTRRSVV